MTTTEIRLGTTVNVDKRLFNSCEYNTKLVVIEIKESGYTLLTISNKPVFNVPSIALTVVN